MLDNTGYVTLAIISDIHSNLESLQIFIQYLNKLQIEKVLFLGDLVGWRTRKRIRIGVIARDLECSQVFFTVRDHLLGRTIVGHPNRLLALFEPLLAQVWRSFP